MMEGDAERTCLENGWSGKQPECIFVKCPDPKDVPNAILTSDAKSPFQLGDKLAYSCQDGYKASGSLSRECQRGGVWSGADPVCQFVDCGNPPAIDNANVTMVNGRTSYNAAADYTCHPDYLPAGKVTNRRLLLRQCLEFHLTLNKPAFHPFISMINYSQLLPVLQSQ